MTPFQLTPIGTSAAWYNPGEPTSGFLLEADGMRVLVDCGSGVIARYLHLFGAQAPIDAVVLTHVHADHCADVVPLAYGIQYGTLDWSTQLWLPPGARDRLGRLLSTWDQDASFLDEHFDVREYAPADSFELGSLQVSSLLVPHYIECFALRFDHRSGSSFGYTADTGPCPDLPDFLRDVDVLLSEAAVADDAGTEVLGQPDRGHITATEAGQLAADAGAGSLLLTHVPVELDFERSIASARAVFDGRVAMARSGERCAIGERLRLAR